MKTLGRRFFLRDAGRWPTMLDRRFPADGSGPVLHARKEVQAKCLHTPGASATIPESSVG